MPTALTPVLILWQVFTSLCSPGSTSGLAGYTPHCPPTPAYPRAGDRKRQNPREEKGAGSRLCPPTTQLSSAFKSDTAHSLHTAWNTVDGKMSIKDCPILWSEGPLSISSRSSPAVCRHSASLRLEALKKPERAQEPGGNFKGPREQVQYRLDHAGHLPLCAQLRGSWPCLLASPPNTGTRTTDQGLPWPQPPSPKGWCSPMAGSRQGGVPQPPVAAGHAPSNVKTIYAKKAPELGNPVPRGGPGSAATLSSPESEHQVWLRIDLVRATPLEGWHRRCQGTYFRKISFKSRSPL